ncbi:hypothetical protein [Sphingobium sp. CAP-1]|nr:hypothetical protein [Sphingobium sp. CAP-1]QGP78110.1 hypothetical protein GL174_03175 [Sphingobium sp. CAP-1]
MAIMIGLPTAVIFLNRWKPRLGWWLLGSVVALVVMGNIIEQSVGRL